MPQTKPMISVVNVVASASLMQKMDLNEITRNISRCRISSRRISRTSFRLKTPKSATLIFSSGKMVCTGSKSEELAKKAVKTVVQQLRKGGIKVKKDAVVSIQNIVSSINLVAKSTWSKQQEHYQEVCTNLNNSQDLFTECLTQRQSS